MTRLKAIRNVRSEIVKGKEYESLGIHVCQLTNHSYYQIEAGRHSGICFANTLFHISHFRIIGERHESI